MAEVALFRICALLA